MADYLNYNFLSDSYVPVGSESPVCPNCSTPHDAKSHLIDVIVPTNGTHSSGGTLPVWRCDNCNEVFSGRTDKMKQLYDRNSHSVAHRSLVNDQDFIIELKHRFSELIADSNVVWQLDQFIDNHSPVNQNTIDIMSAQINELKVDKIERDKDPMYDLRVRTSKFRLEE